MLLCFAEPRKTKNVQDIGPTVEQQLALDPFSKVIGSGLVWGLIAVHTSKADLFCRLWCPFEMNEATKVQVRVEAAASMAYATDLEKNYRYFLDKIVADDEDTEKALDMFAKRYLRVDTSTAECSSPKDQTWISGQIKQSGGFKLLDDIILEKRKHLTKGIMAAHKRLVIQPCVNNTPMPKCVCRLQCGCCEMLNGTLMSRDWSKLCMMLRKVVLTMPPFIVLTRSCGG